MELFVLDHQRRHDFKYRAVSAGTFTDNALVEALLYDDLAQSGIDLAEVDTPDQTHTADLQTAVQRRHLFFEERLHQLALASCLRLYVVREQELKRSRARHKAELIAAEGAVVFAGLPAVQLFLEQHDRQRHTHAADGLGHNHHVGNDARALKGEEGARAAAAYLHVVDDQQNVVLIAERAHAAKELVGEGTDAALRLQGLHHDRRRLVHRGVVVVKQGLHVGEHVQPLEHIGSGNVGDVAERGAAAVAGVHLGGQRQRAEGHAVEAAHEGKHVSSARFLSGELERRLDGVGARGTAELDLVFQAARLDDFLFQRLNKVALGNGVHIQRVDNAVAGKVLRHLLLDVGVVVTVVHRARTAEKVDVVVTVLIGQGRAHRIGKHLGKVSAVGAYFGFIGFKCACVHILSLHSDCLIAVI